MENSPDIARPAGEPTGYDPAFLGPIVPLPRLVDATIETVVLTYTHFSVVLRPDRRLAAATAVGIDGALLKTIPRQSQWLLDPRVPVAAQTGKEVYEDNAFDRGHLVRRLDPVWGGQAEAESANGDTFHFTNAAPQSAKFNQGKQLWAGLEDYLRDNAADFDRKLVVFTGPVLRETDPLYRGVRIPLSFWKVAAFLQAGVLASTAYVLDQTPDLSDEAVAAAESAGEPPALGPFRTFQVPVADVVELTGLDLGPLPAADRFGAVVGAQESVAGEHRWTRLGAYADITLDSVGN